MWGRFQRPIQSVLTAHNIKSADLLGNACLLIINLCRLAVVGGKYMNVQDNSVIVDVFIQQHRSLENTVREIFRSIANNHNIEMNIYISSLLNVLKDQLISHIEQESKLMNAWVVHHGSTNQQMIFQGFSQTGLGFARSSVDFFKTWQPIQSRNENWSGFVSAILKLTEKLAERTKTEEKLLFPSFKNDTFVSPLFLEGNKSNDNSAINSCRFFLGKGKNKAIGAEHLCSLTLSAITEFLVTDDLHVDDTPRNAGFEIVENYSSWVEYIDKPVFEL